MSDLITKSCQIESSNMDTLFNIVKNLHNASKHEEAMFILANMWQHLALTGKIDDGKMLEIFKYMIISCYYVERFKQFGLTICDIYLHNGHDTEVLFNSRWYQTPLVIKDKLVVNFTAPLIENPKKEYIGQRYNVMNPVIVRQKLDSTKFWYLVRCVNYHQEFAQHFYVMSNNGVVNTRNYLLSLDSELNVEQQWEIVDKLDIKRYPTHVEGLEDCRLLTRINPDNTDLEELFFSCALYYSHEIGVPKIAWCQLETPDKSNDIVYLKSLETLYKPTRDGIEKNWLPYEKDGQLFFQYKSAPRTIYNFNPNKVNDSFELVSEESNKMQETGTNRVRNSGGPIIWEYNNISGVLTIAHEVSFHDNKREYYHRFIFYPDNDSEILISHLFYFEHLGIEFCPSIEIKDSTHIYMGIGIEDKECHIYVVENKIINDMLHVVPGILDL